jgi:hypothetical protein
MSQDIQDGGLTFSLLGFSLPAGRGGGGLVAAAGVEGEAAVASPLSALAAWAGGAPAGAGIPGAGAPLAGNVPAAAVS